MCPAVGFLGEFAREHEINGLLMRQELAFLSHLVPLIGETPTGATNPAARPAPRAPPYRPAPPLDLKAQPACRSPLGSVPSTSRRCTTEDADIAKTLIEFNSQQASYQAALEAGASIVQNSLMDFLRWIRPER